MKILHKSVFAAVLLLSIVAAASMGATAADVTIANETVTVTENTDTVYTEINNTNATQTNVTITWTAIDSGGNETSLASNNHSIAGNTVSLFEQSINGSTNESARIEVTLDNTTAAKENVTVEVGTFEQSVGGGAIGGTTAGVGIGVIAILAAGLYIMVKE